MTGYGEWCPCQTIGQTENQFNSWVCPRFVQMNYEAYISNDIYAVYVAGTCKTN